MEALGRGERAEAQVVRAYGVHPVTLAKRKRRFLERGGCVILELMPT